MSSNEAIKRIPEAVAGIVKKVETAAGEAVSDLEATGEGLVNKIGRVVDVVKKPLIEADALLDELIGGDNGGPALDAVEGVTDTAGAFSNNVVAGRVVDAAVRGAATAAAPQPSKLGKPTGGITAGDIFK